MYGALQPVPELVPGTVAADRSAASEEKVMEEAKKFLNTYRVLNIRTGRLIRRRDYLRERIFSAVPNLAHERVDGGGALDPAVLMAQLHDIDRELRALKAETVRARQRILAVITRLPDERLREILTARYIDCCTFCSVSERLLIDERWIYRLHRRALGEVKQILQADEGKKTENGGRIL